MHHLDAGLGVIRGTVEALRGRLIEHPRQGHVNGLENAALHRQQMGREDEITGKPALARQRLLQLGEVPVRVADRVGAIVLGDFPEQQFAFGIAARAGDARGCVDDDFARRIDEPELGQRDQREQRGRRIAPRIGDELRIGKARARELGEPIHRLG